MPINRDKPDLWNDDVARSVDTYNDWFMRFAPQAFQDTRMETTRQVEAALRATSNLTDITPILLAGNPSVLQILRMSTAPPIARDRLIGLAGVSDNLVDTMEKQQRLPPRMPLAALEADLGKIGDLIERLADKYIFHWLQTGAIPAEAEVHRAATIVADRLCSAVTDPIVRNAQEQRQLALVREWLEMRSYTYVQGGTGLSIRTMQAGTFAFRLNVPINQAGRATSVNIPVDVAIMPRSAQAGQLPILIEAKSAGDFTNTNKRRKEEATKVVQLRATYGNGVQFVLFLCGYFDSGYLGYEAAEGIDWIWEHRIEDMAALGI